MFKRIKFLFQKIFKGYTDEDLWDLYGITTRFILPKLIAFKEMNRSGHPVDLKNMEEWDVILDKMIFAFKHTFNTYYISDEEYGGLSENVCTNAIIEAHNKYKEGMFLFAEYFGGLWN